MSYSAALQGGTSGNYNGYRREWMKPRDVASITSNSFTKEYDLTFSLGRTTSRREVVDLLCRCGALKSYADVNNCLGMISIGNNVLNGQVLIQCLKPGLCDEIVQKLINMEDSPVRRCHTYSNGEVPVKFHFIHPSVDIERDVVKNFLSSFGQVKEWHATRDSVFKLLTGAYVFVMYEKDLKKNPLPSTVFINGVPSAVTYKSRPKICFTCGKEGHFKNECSENDPRPKVCFHCGKEGHIKRECPALNRAGYRPQDATVVVDPLSISGQQDGSPFLPGVRPEDDVRRKSNSGSSDTSKVVDEDSNGEKDNSALANSDTLADNADKVDNLVFFGPPTFAQTQSKLHGSNKLLNTLEEKKAASSGALTDSSDSLKNTVPTAVEITLNSLKVPSLGGKSKSCTQPDAVISSSPVYSKRHSGAGDIPDPTSKKTKLLKIDIPRKLASQRNTEEVPADGDRDMEISSDDDLDLTDTDFSRLSNSNGGGGVVDPNEKKGFLQIVNVNNLKVDLDISIDADDGKDGSKMDWALQEAPVPPDPEAT